MKFGAWIHTNDDTPIDTLIQSASENGLDTIRCYHYAYAEHAAPALKRVGLSLLGGMHIDSSSLVEDWRSQVSLEELAHYHDLGIPLEGICVGNELREGGDDPEKKRFTARLSFGLANVLDRYRSWLGNHGFSTPLTYAMEGIVFDREGNFFEWLWPLVDACDIIGVNLYPMGSDDWFTFDAFEESRRFLHEPRTRHNRLNTFEYYLRCLLAQLAPLGKPLILTETGFPSAVGYRMEDGRLVVPETDPEAFASTMGTFIELIQRANVDYGNPIRALYFYEWRDNLYHSKIWNVEQSPIHVAFGLCDRNGKPKLDIRHLVIQSR